MTTLNDIKQQLKDELSKELVDFSRIYELNQQFIAQDKESVRFTIDAKHIHRLGFELVGKQETALSELIKNAYDADATIVKIEFSNYEKEGGTLIISDDGHGMTEDVIRNAWMRLSTNDKELSPVSPKYGRSKAGRKGIGRFAVERLGKRLTLDTMTAGVTKGTRVRFDWDKDFKPGVELNQISYKLEYFEKESSLHGTKLTIENLRDKWNDNIFERVWKSVLLLQPPFKTVSHPRAVNYNPNDYDVDPGFNVSINGKVGDDVAAEFSIEKSFLVHGLAKIIGTIEENGTASFELLSSQLDIVEKQIVDEKFFLAGKLYFEAVYFIYSPDLMTGFSVREAQKLGEKYGGIRIYRDGFRVLPYGEQYDDWLKMAYDSARRFILAPANNMNLFGHLEVNSFDNPLLEETSSREGLIENEAYDEVRSFVRSCIDWAILRIASKRLRKQKAGQKDFKAEYKKVSDEALELLNDLKKESVGLNEIPGTSISHDAINKLEVIVSKQKQYEEEVERKFKEHIQYESMLRVLASLGISLSVFSHEIGGALSGVDNNLLDIKSILSKDCFNKDDVYSSLQDLQSSTDRLYDISKYILSLINLSSSREKDFLPLNEVINSFINQFKTYLNTRSIEFDVKINPPFIRTELMHRSELDSVLFNFLTNSVKSMDRVNSKERRICITAKRINKLAVINFQDTGGGVQQEIADRIFDAFFTTSHSKGDEIAGPGSGLGLKIVSDIAEANKGYVKLVTPEQGYKCNFEFAVPLSRNQV